MTRHLSILLALLACLVLPLFAQETENQTTPREINLKISKDVLSLLLDPMTKEEIEEEAKSWQAVLKEKAQAIADLEIQQIQGEGDSAENSARLAGLRDEKAAIIQRAELVLDAYEIKGGDPEPGRKYISAVKGIKTGVNDVSSRVHAFNSWFTSRDGGIQMVIQACQFVGVIVLFWIVSIFASKLIKRAIEKQPHFSSLLKVFVNKMSRRIILAIGLIVALGTVGVNVGAALALIGGGAFILAFALQDTLSNFASGIMLIIYRPFDVGDAVELGSVSGSVDSVSLVSTTIRTFDNQKVLIPNKKVWGETITNITGMPTRRVDMTFGIGYDDDSDKAQEILERIVAEHELVLETPAPAIHLHELADSSVNFICRPWAKTSDHWTVYWDITKRVKKEFDAAGISIPYPQTDVHLHTIQPAAAEAAGKQETGA
ncbi:mechanosensitive ion channel family protein [Luteolibacter algae]|uniref:Mechanosensitive ion channel family protein n=1 Tax=Luteolibacter algae TaxID=454151 RepID=A0ABW5D5Y0_9BACT